MKIETYRTILDNSYKNIIDYRTLTDSSNSTLNKLDEDTLFTLFNTKVATYENVNFDYGNVITTSLTIDVSQHITCLVPNYLKATPQSGEYDILGQGNPMYYFITDVIQLNKYTWKLILELDVMTTYFKYMTFNSKVVFERRHCERFGYATSDKLYFTYNRDCLLDNTSIEPNILYTKDISYTYPNLKGDMLTLVKTLNECKWLYVFLSNNIPLETTDGVGKYIFQYKGDSKDWQNYPYVQRNYTQVPLHEGGLSGNNYASLPFRTLVFPVFTSICANGNNIGSSKGTKGIEDVLGCTELTPYILSAKLSNRCPFTQSQITANIQTTRNSNGYYLLKDNSRGVFTDGTTYPVIIQGSRDYTLGFFYQYEITDHQINIFPTIANFTTLPTINDKRNINLEPQFYTSKYCKQGIMPYNKELMIIEPYYAIDSIKPSTINFTIYEYDYTYLNYDVTSFIYPYQNSGQINNCKSYVNNSDWCIVNDNYQQAMASSKNSLYTGLESQIVGSLTSTLTSSIVAPSINDDGIITSNTKGKAIGNFINFGMNTINSMNNFNAKLKDMQNSPNSIKIQGMDILNELNYFGKGVGKYISYQLDDTQKEVVYNYYYDYGYQVNKPYSLSTKIEYGTNIITRKLFNYIKIKDEDFIYKSIYLAKLPNCIKDKIYTIFNNGFKLWEFIDCTSSFISDYHFSNENENIEIYDIKEVNL